MKAYLEHINITVPNVEEAIEFIQLALPEFNIRGKGTNQAGRPWVHIGTESSYLAVNEAREVSPEKNYDRSGFNHGGFVVEDADKLAERLLNAGYERSYPEEREKHRIRQYFFDGAGVEWEFVQYLSDKDEERNSYE